MAFTIEKSNFQHGRNHSKETCKYYKEQGQWARKCKKKKQDLWAKEEQKYNVDCDKTFV